MNAADLAALHAAAFDIDRPWSASEFTAVLDTSYTELFHTAHGFALTRTLAGESELLTLAVHPDHHRKGIAAMLMRDWLGHIQKSAETAFLEVAEDNHAAKALYVSFGFDHVGTRAAYYKRKSTAHADALIYRRRLTCR